MEALNLTMNQPRLNVLSPAARSEQQIETSRRNGTLSRGPTSMFGKRRSRSNSLKHGLFASTLPCVDTVLLKRQDADEILGNLIRDFDPQTQMEQALVESLTVNLVRLKIVLQMDMSLHAIPPTDKFISPTNMLPPIDLDQAANEVAILETVSRTLAAKAPFALTPQDVTALVEIFRWVMGTGLPEARSCRRVLDPLIREYPVKDNGQMTEDFKMFCMLDDIFRNQASQVDLSGITGVITELKDLKLRQLAEAKQTAERVQRGLEQDILNKANVGMAKFETVMRYETHVRRMIEKDLRTLVSLKQLREREESINLPLPPLPEE